MWFSAANSTEKHCSDGHNRMIRTIEYVFGGGMERGLIRLLLFSERIRRTIIEWK